MTTAPYGTWASPITAATLTEHARGVKEPGANGDDVLWLESRPEEAGRQVLVRRQGEEIADFTPAPFNVRSRVHEYGGGSWAATGDIAVFTNFTDNGVYRIDFSRPDSEPIRLTTNESLRYADFLLDPANDRVIAVREDQSVEDAEPVNTLVQLSISGENPDGGTILVSGTDFVASPALAADGRLAWLSWNHPNMPWDGTELWTASLSPDGTLSDVELVAGGPEESIFLPRWAPDGSLVFVSDRSGWWNLYQRSVEGKVTAITQAEAEFGLPQWVFGMSTYDIAADGMIYVAWTRDGLWSLGAIDPVTGVNHQYDLPFSDIADVQVQQTRDAVLFRGASPTMPAALIRLDTHEGTWEVISRPSESDVPEGVISVAEAVSWTGEDGQTAHGLFYAPANEGFTVPEGELPPLIVQSHGGPTGSTSSGFDLRIQYWTSRGFAVLDVNYGGSTGYGRAYRDRLRGNWGIVDVGDCVTGARWLAERGSVDGERLAIKGGSAGGYTTLAALTFRDVFRAGVSRYGIGDLEALARETHKFESRYLDGLIGPYPEARETYIERSPIHHTDQLACAMLLLQGEDDKVVPPGQAQTMADAVRAKNLPVAMLLFPGEGHGFRSAETVHRATEAELSFYGQVFGFTPADDIAPLEVENLRASSS